MNKPGAPGYIGLGSALAAYEAQLSATNPVFVIDEELKKDKHLVSYYDYASTSGPIPQLERELAVRSKSWTKLLADFSGGCLRFYINGKHGVVEVPRSLRAEQISRPERNASARLE